MKSSEVKSASALGSASSNQCTFIISLCLSSLRLVPIVNGIQPPFGTSLQKCARVLFMCVLVWVGWWIGVAHLLPHGGRPLTFSVSASGSRWPPMKDSLIANAYDANRQAVSPSVRQQATRQGSEQPE